MFHLPDITLVVQAGDRIALSEAAVEDVMDKFAFDDVLIFADRPLALTWPTIVTPMRSVGDATRVAWREVHPRVRTPHILSMHWDGYPTEPGMWSEMYQSYDFIGAVWPWFNERTVGNTGFSLQSQRFLRHVLDLDMRQPEDIALCREYRPALEALGIRFAPERVAERFSREYWPDGARTFGFHGIWNMLDFLDDAQMIERLSLLAPQQWASQPVSILSYRALAQKRRALYQWIEGRRGRYGQTA
jgi:hypothetical protein